MNNKKYIEAGNKIGKLVDEKQKQYGNSVDKAAKILKILYPGNVKEKDYIDLLLIVRVCDKLSRISQRNDRGEDLGGESPWRDIAGYGILGWANDDFKAD